MQDVVFVGVLHRMRQFFNKRGGKSCVLWLTVKLLLQVTPLNVLKREVRQVVVFADVENALMQESTLQQRYRISENNLQIARQTTTLTLSQYKLGLVQLDSLLAVQKNMLDAEAQRLDVHYQQIKNRIELHRLMGGSTEPSMMASQGEPDISETL